LLKVWSVLESSVHPFTSSYQHNLAKQQLADSGE